MVTLVPLVLRARFAEELTMSGNFDDDFNCEYDPLTLIGLADGLYDPPKKADSEAAVEIICCEFFV